MYSLTGLLKKLSRDGSVPMVFYNESHLFATESMAKILKFAGEYETPMTYFAKGSGHVEKMDFLLASKQTQQVRLPMKMQNEKNRTGLELAI